MTVIKEPRKWYIKLFTLGKNFSSRTFTDNSKKFLLNAIGLFVVVTFTFYVESVGDDYENRQKYLDVAEAVLGELYRHQVYVDGYIEQTNWVTDMYQKQYDRWEVDNDSIFIDFMEDEEEPDGKYYFAPLSFFNLQNPFNPQSLGFEIFKSGNQDFKMVDPLTTSVITDIMEGTDLEYLKKNSNQVERIIVEEYEILLKKWAGKIDVTLKDENEFWIKNRIFIQNDKELKYLLFKRMNLWEYSIREHVQEYIKNVENDQRILDSMINIFENEKYFLYWKIN